MLGMAEKDQTSALVLARDGLIQRFFGMKGNRPMEASNKQILPAASPEPANLESSVELLSSLGRGLIGIAR
jgi:hypothetical protein